MSTITVVKKSGVAAIATDSLTTYGLEKDSAEYIINHQKIVKVGQSLLGICGPTSAKLMVHDFFVNKKPPTKLNTVNSIFKTWCELHLTLKEDYFLMPNEDEDDTVESTRMDVLIINPQGIFGVSAHRAVQEFSKFYAYGTGAEFAMGAMYAAYKEGTSAEDIAILGIEAAAEFDTKTGLPVISHKVKLEAQKPKL